MWSGLDDRLQVILTGTVTNVEKGWWFRRVCYSEEVTATFWTLTSSLNQTCQKELRSIILRFLVDCTVPFLLLSSFTTYSLPRTSTQRETNSEAAFQETGSILHYKHRKDLQYIQNPLWISTKGKNLSRWDTAVCSGLKRIHIHMHIVNTWIKSEPIPRSGILEAFQPNLWIWCHLRWKVVLVCLEIWGAINHYTASERSSDNSLKHVA